MNAQTENTGIKYQHDKATHIKTLMLMIFISGCALNPQSVVNPIPVAPITTNQTQVWNGQLLPEDNHCQAYFETAKFTLDKLNTEVGLQKPSLIPRRVIRIAPIPPQNSCHVMLTYANGKTASGILSFDTDYSGHVTTVSWVADKDIDARKRTCALSETIKQCTNNGMNFPQPAGIKPLTSTAGYDKGLGLSAAYGNYQPILHQVALHVCYSVIVNRAMNSFDPKYANEEDYRAMQTGVDEIRAVYDFSPYLQGISEQNLADIALQISQDAIQDVYLAKNANKLKTVGDVAHLIEYCGEQHTNFVRTN